MIFAYTPIHKLIMQNSLVWTLTQCNSLFCDGLDIIALYTLNMNTIGLRKMQFFVYAETIYYLNLDIAK